MLFTTVLSAVTTTLPSKLPAASTGHPIITMHPVDFLILFVYLAFVIGIGFVTGKGSKTSEDFFLSGRSIPAWITGLAFISANLGALEVLGMAQQGYEYGMMTANFYWVGAIPAMVFMGVAMMPFFYGSKVRSVPEFLKKRYNEQTRFVNALFFAGLTPVLSGVSMYGMGLVFQDLLGWNFNLAIVVSALVVLAYTFVGGLTASIYNEVLQFFLIVLGTAPIVFLELFANGGWNRFKHALDAMSPGTPTIAATGSKLAHAASAVAAHVAPTGSQWLTTWRDSGGTANPMHITWPGVVLGLGFVLSFSYWCTNFLVVQRALAAKDMNSAQRTPLLAAFPKMFFPFIVILPGVLALPLLKMHPLVAPHPGLAASQNWNNVLPIMMGRYFPPGMLGLGLTALLASFMSGMAGNVTAFNTVFTYDLYAAYINRNAKDEHYLRVGKVMTVVGVLASVGFAYVCANMTSVMDYTQQVFGIVNAPLIAVFLMGMFSTRTTPAGGFWGLIAGSVISGVLLIIRSPWAGQLDIIGKYFSTDMAGTFWCAVWAFLGGALVTYVVSLMTLKKPKSDLVGLVYQVTPKPKEDAALPWYKRPLVLGIIALLATLALNLLFW